MFFYNYSSSIKNIAIDFFIKLQNVQVFKSFKSTNEKESTENDRRVSFNNETDIHYRTASEDSSTSTLRSKIKITYKSSKTVETGFNSTDNKRSYGNSTILFGNQQKKVELENKFDMLLNGNCSWSYKSLKVINNYKADNESNRCSISLTQNETNDCRNGAPQNRIANTAKNKAGNGGMKRKFFDLEEKSPEIVKHFPADNTYDFIEVDKGKTTKKPRRKTVKKSEKNGARQIEPKKVRPSRNKKKVDYVEWDSHSELSSNEQGNRKKSKSKEVGRADLNTKNKHIHFEDEASLIDKVSPISTISGTNNVNDESDCSDDGFIFQTRFSDKNANVVDITNSIEDDSLEASQINTNCEDALLSTSKVENEASGAKISSPDASRIPLVECSPHVVYISRLKEKNGGSESENSSLSLPEIVTNGLDLEDRSIGVHDDDENFMGLEDQIDENCKKLSEEIKEMCDKIKHDMFQSDNETENMNSENSKPEEFGKGFKIKRPKMDANNQKYKVAKVMDYGKNNAMKSMINDNKSGKVNLFELKKENNTKYHIKVNGNNFNNKTNLSETQFSNTESDKDLFNAFEHNTHKNLNKSKSLAQIFNHDTTEELSSDHTYQLEEMDKMSISIHSSNSFEMRSHDLGTVSKRTRKNITSSKKCISNEPQNNNNQWEDGIENSETCRNDLKLEDKFSAQNNLNKNTKSIKHDNKTNLIRPKSTKAITNGEDVPQDFLFSKVGSKENEIMQESYKSLKTKEASVSKPMTWEDLESKLLMELDNNRDGESLEMYSQEDNPKSNVEEEKKHSDFWEEKRKMKIGNFEISQYKKSKRVVTAKKNQQKQMKASNRTLADVPNKASVLESPGHNIINKTVEAMNRATAAYFSKNEDSSFGNWSENSNVEVQNAEYSYSILSTTIQTSSKKLNLTEKRSKYIQNINDEVKQSNLQLQKNMSIEENKLVNENIFSVSTKKVITSNCREANDELLTFEASGQSKNASKKVKNAKKSTKSRNNVEVCPLTLKHTQDGFEESILSSNNPDDSTEDTSRMENGNSNYYLNQHYSLRKRKSANKESGNKKPNISVLKEKQATYFHNSGNKNKASSKSDFSAKGNKKMKRNQDSVESSQSEINSVKQLRNNQTTKQLSPKEKYVQYLKNLFQNDTTQETKINSEGISDIEEGTSLNKSGGTKFLMKDDDLFSISSDDFENDETGYYSEASGLFYDVLDED